MDEKTFYTTIAGAVFQKEEENRYKLKGSTHITLDGELYDIKYELMDLEGYEEPCYDVESSRCGPGGYYSLDTTVFDAIWVTNSTDVEYSIDRRELSYVYNEDKNGDLQFEKKIWIDKYYDDE